MNKINRFLIASLFLLLTTAVQAGSTVSKPADQGPNWAPINNSNGTYVYASSFISPESGSATTLGTYLRLSSGVSGFGPDIRFEVWGDNNGPDAGNVLASTGSLTLVTDTNLTFFSAPVAIENQTLVNGVTYWFVATVVGETVATGSYQVGGHTQNSVCVDNGTFWYSNDRAGVSFDGQNLTPEMAFEVQINGGGTPVCGQIAPPTPVPTLDTAGLLLLILLAGIGGMVFVRTRAV